MIDFLVLLWMQNGHVGFMLSCYDAQLCYDSSTDTFEARYGLRLAKIGTISLAYVGFSSDLEIMSI